MKAGISFEIPRHKYKVFFGNSKENSADLPCILYHYLEQKYFAELEVIDEGDYYHAGDASRLTEKLAFLNYMMLRGRVFKCRL